MTTNTPIIIEHLFKATAENVWNALTNVDEMRKWYFNVNDFKPILNFEFQFVGQGSKGEKYIHLCKITELIPVKTSI